MENTVGKREIVDYEQFLLFPQCFQKTCTADTEKQGLVKQRVKSFAYCGKGLVDYFYLFQLCEMHLMGFQFVVLNNAFLVHRGFKEENSFHANKTQEHQRNKELFEQFKSEMKERYPESKEMC